MWAELYCSPLLVLVNSLVTGELCPPFPGVSGLVLNFTSHLFPKTDNRKLSGNPVSCFLLSMTRISVCEDGIRGYKHSDGRHLAGYKQVNMNKPGCTLLRSKRELFQTKASAGFWTSIAITSPGYYHDHSHMY